MKKSRIGKGNGLMSLPGSPPRSHGFRNGSRQARGEFQNLERHVPPEPLRNKRPDPTRVETSPDALLAQAVLRLNSNILGFVLGILAALTIFVATNWLVIKGGEQVGPHLSLLRVYFIGYRVSFLGSLIGMVYAFVLGYLAGRILGAVYNFVADVRAR